jgi:alpha-methylacyl-CoA racemase
MRSSSELPATSQSGDSVPAGAGPLAGVRVVELGGIGPAPYAAMLLADLGADVVRIDRPRTAPSGSPAMRRGKRSVVLDLRNPADSGIALDLVARADIGIEGFRPGIAEKLGVGPGDCLSHNGQLVYGRMTGWGQDGPWAHKAGHDINYIGLVGALHSIGRSGGPPVVPHCLVGDLGGGGMYLVTGLLAALLHARTTGEGQVVDAAIIDGAATLMTPTYGRLAADDWRDERGVNLLDSGRPWYDVYETADHGWLAVGALEDVFYAQLLDRLGMSTADGDRTDPARWPALRARFAAVFATRTRREWEDIFNGSDACVTPVLGLEDARTHPHNVARRVFDPVTGLPAAAPRFSATPTRISQLTPPSCADTDVVLAEWLGSPGGTQRRSAVPGTAALKKGS